jgi:hypothetical protein
MIINPLYIGLMIRGSQAPRLPGSQAPRSQAQAATRQAGGQEGYSSAGQAGRQAVRVSSVRDEKVHTACLPACGRACISDVDVMCECVHDARAIPKRQSRIANKKYKQR